MDKMDTNDFQPKSLKDIVFDTLDINSAFICAVRISDSRYVQRYIQKGVNINIPSHGNKTFYFDSRASGPNVMVKASTKDGSDIMIQGVFGNTALHLASKNGNNEIVELLIKEGANVNIQNNYKHTALYFAALSKSNDIVETLLKAGCDANLQDIFGQTALHNACFYEVIETLIKAKADVNLQDNRGQTALHLAAQFEINELEILEVLIKAGSIINTPDKKRKTALHYGSECMNARKVEASIEAGADTNFQDINGNTALHFVLPEIEIVHVDSPGKNTHSIIIHNTGYFPTDDESIFEHLCNLNHIVKLLIEAGADVNKQNRYGNTALHLAMYLPDNISLVQTLIGAGANVNKQNVDNETALHFTEESKDCDIVRLLIKEGIDVNTQNRIGNTALHLFSALDSKEIVQELILADIAVNKQNALGKTALHFNMDGICNYEILKVLIMNGACSTIKTSDTYGLEPLQYMNHPNAFLNVFNLHNDFRDYRDVYGNTVFHLFIKTCNLKSQDRIWEYIHDQQVSLFSYNCIQNMFGQTPLHIAASKNENIEVALGGIFSNFDQCNLNLFLRDENGNTFFHKYLASTNYSDSKVACSVVPFIKRFLEGEYKTCSKQNVKQLVQSKNNSGDSPLHTFVKKIYDLSEISFLKQVLEMFIKAGADINSRNSLGETPLHLLIKLFWTEEEAIEFVVKSGADVNIQNIFGESPIFKTHVFNRHNTSSEIKCLEVLTKYGARTDICNKLGQNPMIAYLLELPEKFYSKVVQAFDYKVDGNQQDNNKNNLMHYFAWATAQERRQIYVSLSEKIPWTDLSVCEDSFGQLPCDVAFSRGHERLLKEVCVCKNGVHKDRLVFCPRQILFKSLIQKDDIFQNCVQSKCKYFSECTIKDILNLPFVGLVSFEREANAIKTAVESVIENICRMIGEKDKLLTNTVILSGSVAENTKVGLPDEFDFIFTLEKLSEFMDIEETSDSSYICLKLKKEFRGCSCRRFFDSYCYLDQKGLIDRLHELLQEIIQMPFMYTHSNIFPAEDGLQRPQKSPNFKLTLRWCGKLYKNMIIKIDLVPSCQLKWPSSSKFLSQTSSHKMHQNVDVHVLFQEAQMYVKGRGRAVCLKVQDKTAIRISQANAEKTKMDILPKVAKDAYVISKILCDDRICPSVIDVFHLGGEPRLSSIISSFILKNCLFHVAEEISKEPLSTVSLHGYVCRIFKMLCQCALDGKLPCYSFPWQNVFTFPTFYSDAENRSTCISRAMYAKLILNILGTQQKFHDITPTRNDRPGDFLYFYDLYRMNSADQLYQSDPRLNDKMCANCKKRPGQQNCTLKPCPRCKLWTYCSDQCKKQNLKRHTFACDYHCRKAISNRTDDVV